MRDDAEVRVERLEVKWPSVLHAVRVASGTPCGPAIDSMDSGLRESMLADVQRRMTGPSGTATKHVMTSILARGRCPQICPSGLREWSKFD